MFQIAWALDRPDGSHAKQALVGLTGSTAWIMDLIYESRTGLSPLIHMLAVLMSNNLNIYRKGLWKLLLFEQN